MNRLFIYKNIQYNRSIMEHYDHQVDSFQKDSQLNINYQIRVPTSESVGKSYNGGVEIYLVHSEER